jgi:RNA polymerase sigma-70 factor, ECF subfamily
MTTDSDGELMVKFQQGNAAAVELLFEKYRVPVFNFLYRMLNRERQQAEDLLQEVFMKLLKARDLYEPRARFSTWLFAIARNHCLNYLKSKRYQEGQRSVSLEDPPAEGGLPLAERLPASREVLGDIQQRETLATLERAIGALADDYREVFILHAVEGFTHEQIAEILKQNPATVRVQYHRARGMLRESLRGCEGVRE